MTAKPKKPKPMAPTAYRAAIAQLSLTQEQAATFLGISARTSNGYANGKVIPEPTAKLLRLVTKLNLTPDDVK